MRHFQQAPNRRGGAFPARRHLRLHLLTCAILGRLRTDAASLPLACFRSACLAVRIVRSLAGEDVGLAVHRVRSLAGEDAGLAVHRVRSLAGEDAGLASYRSVRQLFSID